MIAQELYGEQQVAFLNEISEAHRKFAGNYNDIRQAVNKITKDTQLTWLEENPLIVIETSQNLNHTINVTSHLNDNIPLKTDIIGDNDLGVEYINLDNTEDPEPEQSLLMPDENKKKKSNKSKNDGLDENNENSGDNSENDENDENDNDENDNESNNSSVKKVINIDL